MSDLRLATAISRFVVVNTNQVVGRILLLSDAVRVIVCVLVTDPIAEVFCAFVVPVAQVGGDTAPLAFTHV